MFMMMNIGLIFERSCILNISVKALSLIKMCKLVWICCGGYLSRQ